MNGNGPMKAGVWLRVSTDSQTASNQIPDVERFVAHHGYDVTQRYEISASAWNGGKEGGEYRATLQKVLDDAWAGKFSVLIVWALDRITREGAEGALRIIRQLRERGCILVSIKESWLNGSPEIQDVLVSFAGWTAQMESQRRSDRIRAGMARRAAEGKPVGGRPKGAKDRQPRRTAGYTAAWSEGGAMRGARQELARTYTCQNPDCGKEFTSTSPTGAKYCSTKCADQHHYIPVNVEAARAALRVYEEHGEPIPERWGEYARARIAMPGASSGQVADSLGITARQAWRLHMSMETMARRLRGKSATQAAAFEEAAAVLEKAGVTDARELLARRAAQEGGQAASGNSPSS